MGFCFIILQTLPKMIFKGSENIFDLFPTQNLLLCLPRRDGRKAFLTREKQESPIAPPFTVVSF